MKNEEILDESTRLKYILENMKDVIWEVDANAVFTYISPTIKRMVGYEAKEMIGQCILDFLTVDSRNYLVGLLNDTENKAGNADIYHSTLYDVEFVCKDGNTIWCEVNVKPIYKDNTLICYIGISRDISEKKVYEKKLQEMLEMQKQINSQLENFAAYDLLTGAYNRRKFENFLKQEIEKTSKDEGQFSIGMFDIDNFKRINDMNGHNKGDRVLQDITALIKKMLRPTDKLFRWGGDEFIILFPDAKLNEALTSTNLMREAISCNEFDIEGKTVSVSFGVGAYERYETSDHFVNRVDKALLRAKQNGKNVIEQG